MFKFLTTFSAPLVLLSVLIILSAGVATAASLSNTVVSDQCCDAPSEQQPPAPDTPCVDPGCSCSTCSLTILNEIPLITFAAPDHLGPNGHLLRLVPSDFIRSIDYPPETI